MGSLSDYSHDFIHPRWMQDFFHQHSWVQKLRQRGCLGLLGAAQSLGDRSGRFCGTAAGAASPTKTGRGALGEWVMVAMGHHQ